MDATAIAQKTNPAPPGLVPEQDPSVLLEKHYRALGRARAAKDNFAVEGIQQRIRDDVARMTAGDQKKTAESLGGMEQFAAGAGAGAEGPVLGATELLSKVPGLEKLAPDKDTVDAFRSGSDALDKTRFGKAGEFAGAVGASLPLGYGTGAAAEKMAASGALKWLPRAPVSLGLQAGMEGAAMTPPGGDRTANAVQGGLAGVGLGSALRAVRPAYQGFLRDTPEAARLKALGVDNLTMGQRDPGSNLARREELAAGLAGPGPDVEAARNASRRRWQEVVQNEGVAPEVAPPPMATKPRLDPKGMPLDDRLDAIYKDFEKPYSKLHGQPMYPSIMGGSAGRNPAIPLQTSASGRMLGAVDQAILDPQVMATPQDRQMVKAFMDNQLGLLPGGATHPGMLQPVDSSKLLEMRSNVRQQLRKMGSPEMQRAAELLSGVEEALSSAIYSQLPPLKRLLLKNADSAYARYKTVEAAMARAGDKPGGFSPSDLSAAVKQAEVGSQGTSSYARGGGGDLRELSQLGKTVLDNRIPMTGVRSGSLGPLGKPLTAIAGRFSAQAGPRIKDAVFGKLPAQQTVQSLEAALRGKVGDDELAAIASTLMNEYLQQK